MPARPAGQRQARSGTSTPAGATPRPASSPPGPTDREHERQADREHEHEPGPPARTAGAERDQARTAGQLLGHRPPGRPRRPCPPGRARLPTGSTAARPAPHHRRAGPGHRGPPRHHQHGQQAGQERERGGQLLGHGPPGRPRARAPGQPRHQRRPRTAPLRATPGDRQHEHGHHADRQGAVSTPARPTTTASTSTSTSGRAAPQPRPAGPGTTTAHQHGR
ncbi:MAG TPA: hypothetical protein VMV92_04540 [Streptosporangiaceae bacterium]|nr:hypothetical protein [Streptosporangiaceae bacterium]